MKKSMLTIIPFAGATIIAGTILLYACAQQELTVSDNANANSTTLATDNSGGFYEKPLNRTVGAPINGDLGRKWIANYRNVTGQEFTYTIPAIELQAMLDKGAMGISLHYARDEKGQLHVLPMAVDIKSTIMKATDVVTGNGRIEWSTSQKWINSYVGEVHAHYFGADTYISLLKQLKGDKVLLTVALNDESKPQLLMSDASIANPVEFKDASFPCPPYCFEN